MGVRHKFVSAKAEGPDNTLIRPSNWNADHNFPAMSVMVGGNTTWTNMPNAVTEFPNTPRTRYDLTNADEVRIVTTVGVVGTATAVLRFQYSTDQAAWNDLTSTVGSLNSTGCKAGAWAAVPVGAKSDVFIRIVGSGGDGALDPQFRNVELQVR